MAGWPYNLPTSDGRLPPTGLPARRQRQLSSEKACPCCAFDRAAGRAATSPSQNFEACAGRERAIVVEGKTDNTRTLLCMLLCVLWCMLLCPHPWPPVGPAFWARNFLLILHEAAAIHTLENLRGVRPSVEARRVEQRLVLQQVFPGAAEAHFTVKMPVRTRACACAGGHRDNKTRRKREGDRE